MNLLRNFSLAGPLAARLHAHAKGHIVKYGHVLEQRIMLKHKAHIAVAYMRAGSVFTIEYHGATVGLLQASNNSQQGGFSAARRAQQSDQLAAVEIEAHVVQGREIAKLLLNVFDLNAHDDSLINARPAWRLGAQPRF